MTIAQINAVYHYSSTGRTSEEMHQYLLSKGIKSLVIVSRSSVKQEGVFVLNKKLSVKLHSAADRFLGFQSLFSILATLRTIYLLHKNKVDIVILRNLHGSYINLPILLKYLSSMKIPVIPVLHDSWLYTGTCCYYFDVSCNKWETKCNQCPKFQQKQILPLLDSSSLLFFIKKRLFSQIKLYVVGVSDWITTEASRSAVFKNAISYHRIYNWIDQSVFFAKDCNELRDSLGIEKTDFIILGIAQVWLPYKGLHILIDIAKAFPDCKVIIVGHANKEQKEKASDNIIWIDSIDDTQLLSYYYSLSDVFVNCCTQETFGKVSAEALSCGTPVITNRYTANPEIIGTDCGIIVTKYNSEAYIDAVRTIRNHGKSFYTPLCNNRAKELFNINTNLNQYLNLFKEICSSINK